MLSPQFFTESLREQGIEFYAGVPDSLLKSLCAYIADHVEERRHVIAANEGGALAVAAGYHLATGKIPAVYMQNSGEGNIINPLASLTDREVYGIPALLVIGWRGRPGVRDEPQHVKQGEVTLGLLDVMGIRHAVLSGDEKAFPDQLKDAVDHMTATGEAFAFVVGKDTFEPYALRGIGGGEEETLTLTREEAVRAAASSLREGDIVVSTTGMISRELFECREAAGQGHEKDFLTVGSMGHASQIAFGIAMEKPMREVYCFDGDGAAIMHMGSLAVIADRAPGNYRHIVFNNGAHDSVGGQPTAARRMSVAEVARAAGYRSVRSVRDRDGLEAALAWLGRAEAPALLEVRVRKGSRKDLGRPTVPPAENKEAFMKYVQG